MIYVSDKAREKVSKLMQDANIEDANEYFLRVSVVGGGCSGLSYKFKLEPKARASDNIYTMMRTYFSEATNSVRIGLKSPFDNVWFGGSAIDATASPSTGVPQLWTLQTFETSKGAQLLFRPRADGIVNLKYQNYDDWNAVAWGLCNAVVNPGGTQSSPIHCPPKPY